MFIELASTLDMDIETAAVVAASMTNVTTAASVDTSRSFGEVSVASVSLLGQKLTWVDGDSYLERHAFGLSIASSGWVPAFRAAIKAGQVPVFVHTHPGGKALFSSYDDVVDASLAVAARDLGAPAYASVVVAGSSEVPAVIARMCMFDGASGDETNPQERDPEIYLHVMDAIRIAGPALRMMLPPLDDLEEDNASADSAASSAVSSAFDRQVRMLGSQGQRMLGVINVAIVGAGGTGSAVAVQLARIGVGSICLIDDDEVTAPTPTRGHGMRQRDVGRPKVEVLGEHLRDIGLGTRVMGVQEPLHSPPAIQAIQQADVVFSCVDGHGARLILNRFAYAHLAVVIDLAVLVSVSPKGAEVDERVTWIAPGTACLLCRGRLDATQAYAENLDPEERKRLAGEGYVQAAETPQPAIVTLTTLVAALAASEFLLRLVGIGSSAATELLLRPHVGELRRNRIPARTGCFCTEPRFLGRGQKDPYLDLMWPQPPLRTRDGGPSAGGGDD
ncbi:MAG: HesA/MoeB/ThiF family protein [Marmoricola sp.]